MNDVGYFQQRSDFCKLHRKLKFLFIIRRMFHEILQKSVKSNYTLKSLKETVLCSSQN